MNEARQVITTSKESGEPAIKINVAVIPDAVRDNLADATLDFIRDLLRQPEGREMMEAKRAARAAR